MTYSLYCIKHHLRVRKKDQKAENGLAEWTLIFPNSKSLHLTDPKVLDLLDDLDEKTVIACPLAKWLFPMESDQLIESQQSASKLWVLTVDFWKILHLATSTR